MGKNVGESSKNAKEKAILQRNALIAAIRTRRNQGIRISDNSLNASNDRVSQRDTREANVVDKQGKKKMRPTTSNDGDDNASDTLGQQLQQNTSNIEVDIQACNSLTQEKEKKKRGPTRMGLISDQGPRMIVEYNERGQAISTNSTKLSSYLGVIAREYVPISSDNWNRMDSKQRFVIDESHKKITLRAMGKCWRQYKSKLTKKIRDAKGKNSKSISTLRPSHVDPEEWRKFTKDRLSKEFEAKSCKFRKIRNDQKFLHTMSRKGYARLEHEMQSESSNQSSISRVDVWTRGHTRKNGEPINQEVGDAF